MTDLEFTQHRLDDAIEAIDKLQRQLAHTRTLDQIEEWLQKEMRDHVACSRYGAFAYLLAQVQAWKEKA